MPIYEYRCRHCQALTERLAPIASIPAQIACDACGEVAARIISHTAVRLSARSKVGRLDPKYDRMVDRAMRRTPGADPDRLLNRRGDIAKGRPDD